ncbi:MAG: protoheme IX farnesyltransferase [Myxococcaceae bacterium]|nr:protoheme IX farnesyltransferase [Myxococcaceae bacterium]
MNARAVTFSSAASDLIALTKPRLSALVIATTAGGLWLAPGQVPVTRALLTIIAVSAVVGAANALNCWWERDSDRLMARTRNRPLPAGRLEPQLALWFGISLAAVSLPVLFLAVNVLTGVLSTIAFLSYVLVYTPLKRRTSAAMIIGGLPGALPPLMGWTAVTGRMDTPGLVLFALLFLWQIPHFIAIALFRREEYERAGIKVITSEKGDAISRFYAVVWLVPLIAISVLPFTLGTAGLVYLVTALVLGALFLGVGMYGFLRELGNKWARQLLRVSLLYLTGLFIALMLDAAPKG